MNTVISAGGIVFKEQDNKRLILLVIKDDGGLVFPKGHVETGETLEAAALREVTEETGLLDLELGPKLGVVTRESVEKTGELVLKQIHLFTMTSSSFAHQTAEEPYGWFEIPEALRKLKFVEERKFLEKLLDSQMLQSPNE